MATNVVVIDSTARRVTVKTTPGRYLSDVLSEACTKLGADPSQHGLKYNNKPVDLSKPIRLSGLTSGAKLELVQSSKSAGVVNVALQIPDTQATASPARLTDKFPSTTTLWLLLRKFEAGVAGSASKNNFTARGAPSSGSGAGRLFYEQPVLSIMGRELTSFTDLQKNLAQLGLNNGSVLIKLSFRTSDQPLEEAMAQIQSYFDTADPREAGPSTTEQETQERRTAEQDMPSQSNDAGPVQPEWLEDHEVTKVDLLPSQSSANDQSTPSTAIVSDRPVSVFRPPSSAGPPPTPHNESDYVPTVEHAQVHQKHLQQESRNRRLPTDAEILAKEQEQQEELAKLDSVEVKIRFPDQSSVSSSFGQQDTTGTLYTFVRQCLASSLSTEPFLLRNPGVRDKTGGVVVENQKRLILDLQLRGRVLVVFSWHDGASPAARGSKSVLNAELASQARDYVPPQIDSSTDEQADKAVTVNLGPQKATDDGASQGKMPKWLKGLGKK